MTNGEITLILNRCLVHDETIIDAFKLVCNDIWIQGDKEKSFELSSGVMQMILEYLPSDLFQKLMESIDKVTEQTKKEGGD